MLKKNLRLLLILPFLSLASCVSNSSTTPTVPDSTHSSDEKPSSSSTPTITDKERIDQVLKGLKKVSESTSYTVNYEEDDGTGLDTLKLTDIYTHNYISIGFMNGGYLTLPSYDETLGKTMVYDFKYDTESNIVLGKAVTYYDENDNLKTVPDCTAMDYMKLISNDPAYAIDSEMLTVENGILTTEDETLLYILANEMGYDVDDYIITSARFDFTGEDLTFYLYNQISPDTTETQLLVKATFTDLNTTEDQKLQAYIDNYKLPSSSLSEDISSKFIASTVGFDTEIKYRSQSGFIDFGSISLTSYFDEADPMNNKMAYHLVDSINQEEYDYVLSVGENNQAVDHYIDGNNMPAEQPFANSEYTWGNGIFSIQEEFDDNFLGYDDGSYQYFGINIDKLYESITAISVLTDLNIKSIDSLILTEEDNTVTLTAELSAFYYGSDGEAVDLSVRTISTMQISPVITLPTSYEPTQISSTLANAFNSIKNQESYIARGYALKADGTEASSLPSNSYYLKKDEYFITNSTDRDDYVNKITGYKQVSDGLVPFSVDKQGQVTQTGDLLPEKSLSDIVPWTLSPDIFDQESNLTYKVKRHVKHENENMIGGSTLSAMLDSSLTLKLDDSGRLDKVNYQYVYRGILAGKEEVKFEYSSEQALPDFINSESFAALDGSEHILSSWAEEKDSKIHTKMCEMFGEEISDTIPYLYDKEISDTWNLGTNYDGTGDMCIYSQATKGTDYMARYIEYIKTLGYAETTIDDLTYYVKDEVKIRIGESNENADFSTYIYFGKVEQ